MTKIIIVGFDGLHRSGKGSQIQLLKEHIELEGDLVHILRGDGSRLGEGTESDPHSKWWQDYQSNLKQTDNEGNLIETYWDTAANKLNHELFTFVYFQFPDILETQNKEMGYVLLDRTLISRYFVKKRTKDETTLESLLKFKFEDLDTCNTVVPTYSFILHAPKTVLLQRNEKISDHPQKYLFRKKNIDEYYNHFEEITRNIHTDLFSIYHLDATENPIDIHNKIYNLIKHGG